MKVIVPERMLSVRLDIPACVFETAVEASRQVRLSIDNVKQAQEHCRTLHADPSSSQQQRDKSARRLYFAMEDFSWQIGNVIKILDEKGL